MPTCPCSHQSSSPALASSSLPLERKSYPRPLAPPPLLSLRPPHTHSLDESFSSLPPSATLSRCVLLSICPPLSLSQRFFLPFYLHQLRHQPPLLSLYPLLSLSLDTSLSHFVSTNSGTGLLFLPSVRHSLTLNASLSHSASTSSNIDLLFSPSIRLIFGWSPFEQFGLSSSPVYAKESTMRWDPAFPS